MARGAIHEVFDGGFEGLCSEILKDAPEVPIRKYPMQVFCIVYDQEAAALLVRELREAVDQFVVGMADGGGAAGEHEVLDFEGHAAAYATCGVVEGVAFQGELLPLHQLDGEEVAEEVLQDAGSGGDEVHGAELLIQGELEEGVAPFGEPAFGVGDDGDGVGLFIAYVGEEIEELLGLAAFAEEHEHVAWVDKADIAVQRVGGGEVERPGRYRGHGEGDLLGDQTAFSHAGKEYFSLALLGEVDELFKFLQVEMGEKVVYA